MKLGSLKGGRDGRLIVVNRSLDSYVTADDVAPTLQAALDDWANAAPRLEAISRAKSGTVLADIRATLERFIDSILSEGRRPNHSLLFTKRHKLC